MANNKEDKNKKWREEKLAAFEQWLKNVSDRWNDPASVSSYKSGVGSMIKWVNENKDLWETSGGTKVQDFEWYLQNIGSVADRDTFFSAVSNIIQIGIENNRGKKSILQNWKSHLCAFEAFFKNKGYLESSAPLSDSQKRMLKNNSSCATYTQEELIKEFQGRILTQDRISMSKTILFPIRLITRLWPDDSKKWAKGVCENIYLIVQKKGTEKIFEKQIKDIEALKIEKKGEVTVKVDNDKNDYIMCTSYSDPHEYTKIDIKNRTIKYVKKGTKNIDKVKEYEISQDGFKIDKNKNILDFKNNIIFWHVKPVKIKRLGDIAIDHDIPISLVLKEKERKLSTLLTMSDVYRTLSYEYGLKVSAKEVNNFCSKIGDDELNKQFKEYPKNDLELIGNCKLVLMSKDENSQKSDS